LIFYKSTEKITKFYKSMILNNLYCKNDFHTYKYLIFYKIYVLIPYKAIIFMIVIPVIEDFNAMDT